MYAMLDTGATRTIILEDIVNKLGLKVRKMNTKIIAFELIHQGDRKLTDLHIQNLDADGKFKIENAIVGQIITTEEDTPPKNSEIQNQDYLRGVAFSELPSDEIGIILFAEYSHSWIGGEIRRGPMNKPIAFNTLWGWTLIGL